MSKRMIFYALILCVFFSYSGSPNATAGVRDASDDQACSTQVFAAAGESNPLPQTKEMDEIEKELKRLMEDVKRLEKVIKKRIQKEVLPHIKREIKKLRKWLRELQPEDDNPDPQKTRTTRDHQKQVVVLCY